MMTEDLQLLQDDERSQEIDKLCKDVHQINELFVDMARLVDEQGLVINNIESNINSTFDNTQDGVVQVVKAKEHQKKAGNKLKIALGSLTGVVATVLIAVGIGKAVH